METTRWSVEKLVKQFGKEIRIPEIQRKYVWTREKARALIDSLYKDYPSGSMLLWKAGGPETRGAAAGRESAGGQYLLLDGQQRLASLHAIITGAPARGRAGGAARGSKIEIRFDMDHPDFPIEPDTADLDEGGGEHAVFKLKSPCDGPHWIDVTRLFKEGPTAVLAENSDLRDPRFQKRLRRLNTLYSKLVTYSYPVQILEGSYAEAADAFVRINSQGSSMRKSDLALAQVTSRWKGSMELFSALSEKCREKGRRLDEGFVIRCLMAVATGRSGPERVGPAHMKQIRKSWEKTEASLMFVIDFLDNACAKTARSAQSRLPLIPLVCIAAKHDCRFPPALEESAAGWFCEALASGRYSKRSAEAALGEDLRLIRDHDSPMYEVTYPHKSRLRQISPVKIRA